MLQQLIWESALYELYIQFGSCVQSDMEIIIWFILVHKRKFKLSTHME